MILVADACLLIDLLRDDPRAAGLRERLRNTDDELWSVTPVRTALLAGLRSGEEGDTLKLLDALRWQDVTVEVADRAGHLARRYLRSHPGIDTIDYLIAAATQHLRGRLLTRNVRHFPMFAGLTPAY